jgi:hypothetical protein
MPSQMPSGTGVSPAPQDVQRSADERELVAAVLRRDRKASARFVADYTDPVYAYVRHRLAPRADLVDDIVQNVFRMPRFIDRVNSREG